MKFAMTTLYVKDMEKSIHFYSKIMEMPLIRRQPMGDGNELVFLGIEDEHNLELISADKDTTYSGFILGFEVDDLEIIKERLSDNGYPIKHEVSPTGAYTLCFLDGPDGEDIELIMYK